MYKTQVGGKDFYIPDRMLDGIKRYVEDGIIPGSFLRAIIENDLRNAVGCADDENLVNIPAYVSYFYNETPGACWGSKEKMKRWVEYKTQGKEMEE